MIGEGRYWGAKFFRQLGGDNSRISELCNEVADCFDEVAEHTRQMTAARHGAEQSEEVVKIFCAPEVRKEIPDTIGKGFMKLEEYMNINGFLPSNTPFLQIKGDNPESINIMIGTETAQKLPSNGEIENYTIPAGKKIFCYWEGSNEDMSPLYEDMQKFADERGLKIQEGFYEYYLNDPSYGVDKLLTKVVMLIQ